MQNISHIRKYFENILHPRYKGNFRFDLVELADKPSCRTYLSFTLPDVNYYDLALNPLVFIQNFVKFEEELVEIVAPDYNQLKKDIEFYKRAMSEIVRIDQVPKENEPVNNHVNIYLSNNTLTK